MLDDEEGVADDDEDDGVLEDEDDDELADDSMRPVISTFLPTCFARSFESPSRTYDMPVPLVALALVPDVPVALEVLVGDDEELVGGVELAGLLEEAVELEELGIDDEVPLMASLRMNELLADVADPDVLLVLPLVPVALGMLPLPFSRQPVNVILSLELALLLLLVWSLVALCAAPTATAEKHAIAIAALIRFILLPP